MILSRSCSGAAPSFDTKFISSDTTPIRNCQLGDSRLPRKLRREQLYRRLRSVAMTILATAFALAPLALALGRTLTRLSRRTDRFRPRVTVREPASRASVKRIDPRECAKDAVVRGRVVQSTSRRGLSAAVRGLVPSRAVFCRAIHRASHDAAAVVQRRVAAVRPRTSVLSDVSRSVDAVPSIAPDRRAVGRLAPILGCGTIRVVRVMVRLGAHPPHSHRSTAAIGHRSRLVWAARTPASSTHGVACARPWFYCIRRPISCTPARRTGTAPRGHCLRHGGASLAMRRHSAIVFAIARTDTGVSPSDNSARRARAVALRAPHAARCCGIKTPRLTLAREPRVTGAARRALRAGRRMLGVTRAAPRSGRA